MSSSSGFLSRLVLAAVTFIAVPAASCAAAPAQPDAGAVLVGRYAAALGGAHVRLPLAARRDLAERMLLLSSYYKIDPCLLAALVTVESAWRSYAVSPAGALGYGQLMPQTASALRVDALEPYENLDGTARYLRRMLNRFAGRDQQTRVQLALASYNAGAGAVDRYHGIPPYRETRAYVANVMRTRQTFAASVATRIATHRHAARRTVASAPTSPSRSPYLDALDPNGIPLQPAQRVRYEPSHSFVARFFGLRHRVAEPAAADTPGDATAHLPSR